MTRYEVEVHFHKVLFELNGNRIVVGLTSKPEKGKANLELVKKIADYFDVPSSQVRIISGLKSRSKVIEVFDR